MADKFGLIDDDDGPVVKIFKPNSEENLSELAEKKTSPENNDSKNITHKNDSVKTEVKHSQSSNNFGIKSSSQLVNKPQEKQKPSTSSQPITEQRYHKSSQHSRGSIVVNERQRGNPLLKAFQYNSYHFEKIVPDYIVGSSACVLYLSLKYHNIFPNYIYDRMNKVGNSYALKILVIHIDITDINCTLKEIVRICSLANFTLMCAWSHEDAGKIIENYKCFENKSQESIMEKKISEKNTDYDSIVQAITSIKSVNKTDSMSLISTFDTLANIIRAPPEKLELCPGLGNTKAKILHEYFSKPFKR